ncbi:MAG: flagellar biosynthesis repressor FlbT, partial [Planktotalea sp.]|uniref:flagellar biosynthesis repressor FlbT n=1 Tax=Planktotalea sp. TaxID=2029877 RepID=UPI003C71F68F
MALRLTLKPNERILINGCVVRNSDRRQLLVIENQADIVREADLLDESAARTPVKEVYFFIQAALLDPSKRDKLVPIIQKQLGKLVPVFHDEVAQHIFDAASHVSLRDFYKAMRALRPLMDYEEQLFE